MLSKGAEVFVTCGRDADKRILHPARVLSISGETYAVQLHGSELAIDAGSRVVVFFDLNRKFHKQSAEVVAVSDPRTGHGQGDTQILTVDASKNAGVVFGCNLVGQPVSAEGRESFRVCTVVANIAGDLGIEKNCPLMDVSSTGFAMIAKSKYKISDVVAAALRHEGTEFRGRAVVQSIKELPGERFRYGLHCMEDRGGGNTLVKGCQQISVACQRAQLRRLAAHG
ncbi:MAG: hypothetical protein IT430_17810 [Phycisphaerales bacterium]|nr:hypothetical protein [Phycisphaerales bacterium]